MSGPRHLTIDQFRQREAVVEQFAAAWSADEAPSIEERLSGEGEDRTALALELALVDLEQRWRRGWPACAELYLRRFPALTEAESTLELIRREWDLRAGAHPERLRRELLTRFPDLAASIHRLKAPSAASTLPPGPTLPPTADPVVLGNTDRSGLPLVPGYEVLAELGRGGMGVVYQARQLGTQRVVALKMILSPAHAGPEERLRFRREGQALGGLNHPNIVTVYEVGEHQGLPFFSLELCDGGSLGDQLREGPLPPREAAEVVARVADGMAAAHAAGLVHRDLKPDNVLLDKEGTPKVTDFGLARRLDDVGHTRTGAVMGTPAYMAPEQARGSKEVGPLADVWALGALLYEGLTSRPPFRAATVVDTLDQVLNEEPVPPTRLNRAVPRDLETITLKCLRKSPGERYAGAKDLADDLRRWLNGRPIVARPVGVVERVGKWARRNRAVAGLMAAVVVALAAGAAVATVLAIEARDEARRADTERDAALEAEARAARAAKEEALARARAEEDAHRADSAAHAIQLDQAVRHLHNGELNQARTLIEAAPPRLRETWEQRHAVDYLRRREPIRVFTGHKAGVCALALSSDGLRAVSGSFDRTVRVWDVARGAQLFELAGHKDAVFSVAISRDGGRIVSGSGDGTAKVWDARAGKLLHTLTGHTGQIRGVAISADGKRIVTGSADRTVRVWAAETGALERTLKGHSNSVRSVALSADGQRVVSGSDDKTVIVWSADSGQVKHTLKGHAATVTAVTLSSDGQKIVSGSMDGALLVWEANTGLLRRSLAGHKLWIIGLALSGDGARVLSAQGFAQMVKLSDANLGGDRLLPHGVSAVDFILSVALTADGSRWALGTMSGAIKVWQTDTDQAAMTLPGKGLVVGVAVTEDGRTLCSADNAVRVWDASTGQLRQALSGHTAGVQGVAIRRDGQRLVSGSEDRTVKVWDVARGTALRTLSHSGRIAAVAMTPGGEWIAASAGGVVRVWTADGALKHELKGGVVATGLAFSPDRKYLAAACDKTVILWELATGATVRTLKGHGAIVRAVGFSPDGRLLASGSGDKSIKLWRAGDGKELMTLRGHTEEVLSVAFSSDGARLASGSVDRTVKLWNVRTGQLKLTLLGHTSDVSGVAFSKDGRIASASWDGSVKLWHAPAHPSSPPRGNH